MLWLEHTRVDRDWYEKWPTSNYSTRVQQRIAQCLVEGDGAVGMMARAINSKYEKKMYGKVGTNNEHFTVDWHRTKQGSAVYNCGQHNSASAQHSPPQTQGKVDEISRFSHPHHPSCILAAFYWTRWMKRLNWDKNVKPNEPFSPGGIKHEPDSTNRSSI